MNVTLVGSGNVAFVLGKLLISAGHSIGEVIGRNAETVNSISRLTGAKVSLNFSHLSQETDLCILAVSDNAIVEIANALTLKNQLVVHTSGATSAAILNRFANHGVLYPLQSLRKETLVLPAIPFLIDASNQPGFSLLQQLVFSTGNTAQAANDEQRLRYHLAAVFCSNFTNHLYAIAQQFCNEEGIFFDNLLPVILETAFRITSYPAAQMQTGPAIRRDERTIAKHLTVLQPYPNTTALYRLLTQSIQHYKEQLL